MLPFYGLNLLFILFLDDNLLLNMIWTGITILSKVYHIITCDRVDFLQVNVVNKMSQQQHTKIRVMAYFLFNGYVLFLVSWLVADIFIARILAYDLFQGISSIGSLLFGIQFGVMGIDCFAFLGKMALNAYELVFYRCTHTQEEPLDDEDDLEEQIWENRSIYVQSFEIITSLLKTVFYAVLLYTLYFHSRLSLPLTLIQGGIMSVHSLVKQVYQFISFLSSSDHLKNQLTSPSEEELTAADHMCIICREDMHHPEVFLNTRGRALNPRKHPKKLHCGHILHLCCLKDWLERSDSCPLCRQPVFKTPELASQSQSEDTNLPAEPAPVDRPVVPEATATGTIDLSSETTPAPTPTTSSGLSEADSLVNTHATTILPTSAITSVQDSERSETSVFVPRDWTRLPLTSTSDPRNFRVMLSPTQTANLTIRRNQNVE
ncbi:hypothetical protein JCM33374_g2124 [Metschnikowia sp. JCM 33374]|nr:hypothetical protein JCM33374_g2124 [Metschnikowia sp. JCM 33374]